MRKLQFIWTFIPTVIFVLSMIPVTIPCSSKTEEIQPMKVLERVAEDGFWVLLNGMKVEFSPVPLAFVEIARKVADAALSEFADMLGDMAGRTLVQNLLQENCTEAMEEVHKPIDKPIDRLPANRKIIKKG